MARFDADIDRLYQGALADFTAERNALAKRAGADGAEIRALQKPTVAAWAINRLYWEQRAVYDELIARADDLRATHTATIKGRRTDLRGASQAHEEALAAALKATLALLAGSGQPATDATRQAIATTLRSLPADEPPGRLSRQLEPRGLEMLTGAASPGRVHAPAPKARKEPAADRDKGQAAAAAARLAAAREALAAASRATRAAEQVVRREEFEAARAGREIEKAERRLGEAKEAFEQAKSELAEATRAVSAAAKARDAAQDRAAGAERDLAKARTEEMRARADVDRLS